MEAGSRIQRSEEGRDGRTEVASSWDTLAKIFFGFQNGSPLCFLSSPLAAISPLYSLRLGSQLFVLCQFLFPASNTSLRHSSLVPFANCCLLIHRAGAQKSEMVIFSQFENTLISFSFRLRGRLHKAFLLSLIFLFYGLSVVLGM